jgi:surfactin synthase thioesterase subunit
MTAAAPHDRWFVTRGSRAGARLRLFCLPFAGGGAHTYRGWQAALGPEIEVCAVRLPGRENRLGEPPFAAMDRLVGALTDVVATRLDLPFAIFGHSMGAHVGFELIRRLRRDHDREPARLIASARFAPQLPDPDPPIHHLPDAEFVAELRELEGTPPEVFESPELLELVLPMLRADFTLCETYAYRPEPPLACPISVYGGLGDWTIDRGQLEAWREQTASEFVLRMFPGDHFFIQTQGPKLLETLRRELLPHVKNAAT